MSDEKKQCRVCGQQKPLTGFYRRRDSGTYFRDCKECNKQRTRLWVVANPEATRRIWRASHLKHREKRIKYAREYYYSDVDKHKKISLDRARELRSAAIEKYGGAKCACCGETQVKFLCIDHMNDDGAAHRRTFKGTIERWLYRNNYPPGFQVLCANCNQGKKLNGGICPHAFEVCYRPLTITEIRRKR